MARDPAEEPEGDEDVAGDPGRFTVTDAADLTGVPVRSLQFWSGPARVITPEIASAGRGSRKLFSARNLVQLRVVYLLTQRWIALETVRALMRTAARFRSSGVDWFGFPEDTHGRPIGPAEEEILTCTRWGVWHLYRFPAVPLRLRLTGQVPPGPLGDNQMLGIVGPQEGPESGAGRYDRMSDPLLAAAELFEEMAQQEELLVLNVGRVKRDMARRLRG